MDWWLDPNFFGIGLNVKIYEPKRRIFQPVIWLVTFFFATMSLVNEDLYISYFDAAAELTAKSHIGLYATKYTGLAT